ncbi:MAG: hypothetical protein Q9183_004279, partial [Haloplaca sp. 2 TL-2023]
MASDFIGSVVTVTLVEPTNARIRGLVKSITAGQQLDLKNVTWLETGRRVAALAIETLNIRDVEIEPDTSPESKAPERQPAQDPAILSYNKTPTHQVAARSARFSNDPQAKGKPAHQAYDKAVQAWHDPSQLKVSPALNKKTGIPSD